MYKPHTDHSDRRHELTREQMEKARQGYRGLLWRKRFPADFILGDSDELLALAHAEMVRAIAQGAEIEDPVGWTITCAYRRTGNYLDAKSVRPSEVSIEKFVDLADATAPTPEELAEDEDRWRKIREAVARLDGDQRRLIALTYFGGMSVREAARSLGWHPSKAQRCHESALRALRRRLPVRSSDELEIATGLAAWLTFDTSTGLHLPAGLEAVIDKAGEGAGGLWGRAQELARRLPFGGGDTAAALGSSGAGRAVGACAAAVGIACFAGAGAIVVPDLAGNGNDRPAAAEKRERTAPAVERKAVDLPVAAAETPSPQTTANEPVENRATERQRRRQAQAAQASAQRAETDQVEQQTSGIARAASEAPPESSGASAAAAESAGAETVVVPSGGEASPAAEAQAEQQFGAFK
ncbi:MAG: sigma-70 family RNA polymerase sigma factor [Solirubrobacterales bacterium]